MKSKKEQQELSKDKIKAYKAKWRKSEKYKAWMSANRDRIKQKKKEQHANESLEQKLARRQKRLENRDRINERKRLWSKTEKAKLFRANYRERAAELSERRRKLDPERFYALFNKASKKHRQKLYAIKIRLVDMLGGKCIMCGMKDIRVLDFDHVDPSTKSFNLCTAAMRKSFDTLVVEAQKCQILCSNCHRIKTIENGEWANRRNQRK